MSCVSSVSYKTSLSGLVIRTNIISVIRPISRRNNNNNNNNNRIFIQDNPSVPSTVMNGVLLTKKIKNLINKNIQKNISKENMYLVKNYY